MLYYQFTVRCSIHEKQILGDALSLRRDGTLIVRQQGKSVGVFKGKEWDWIALTGVRELPEVPKAGVE